MSGTPPPKGPLRFVFFDFDGTLAETLTDLYNAVDHTLREIGLPARTYDEVRLFVGKGVRHLIHRCVGEENADRTEQALARFRDYYDRHLMDETKLLPGVMECLRHFAGADLAILSNKPAPYTKRIVEALGLADYFPLILGPDGVEQRKPKPWMMDTALARFGREPSDGILVGDTPVDVETGRNAGVHTVVVLGGFRTRKELEASQPDRIVEDLHELIRLYK